MKIVDRPARSVISSVEVVGLSVGEHPDAEIVEDQEVDGGKFAEPDAPGPVCGPVDVRGPCWP